MEATIESFSPIFLLWDYVLVELEDYLFLVYLNFGLSKSIVAFKPSNL